MRKRLFFTLIITLIMVCVPYAYAETITIDKGLLEKILQRQEALEKKIEALENKKTTAPTTDNKYLQEDVTDISDRLDIIET